jgi:hypothetical protein
MVHKSSRIKIDKSLSANFIQVKKNFSDGATIAYEYFNAAGVLIVPSAIALADALTIKLGGVKCKGENHNEILGILKDLSPDNSQRDNDTFFDFDKLRTGTNDLLEKLRPAHCF